MSGIKWSNEEDQILFENYGKSKPYVIQNLLNGRSWVAIKLRAKHMGLRFYLGVHEHVQADLSILLDDTYKSFYWCGFLAADGSFVKNRLKFTLANEDKDQVIKFSNYVKCDNHRKMCHNSYGVSIQDKYNVTKIINKFDFKPRKTYNPPNLNWMNGDLFLSFLIGFIDGDGSVSYQSGRKTCQLRIKVHRSWKPTLEKMSEKLFGILKLDPRPVKIDRQGYANLGFARQKVLQFLKQKTEELRLPVLARKWDKINEKEVIG